MARKPRLHFPGALFHVMLRGNAGQAIFTEDADRLQFETLVVDGLARFGHRIHAYCWMNNHVHIALQIGAISLSSIIQNLCFRYTRYFNYRNKRNGHLFQGRFKAILVDADSYLLELVRYIHLNPVRARLVTDPESFLWSGHRVYLGLAQKAWLCTDWTLSQFDCDLDEARRRYQHFILSWEESGRHVDFQRGTTSGRLLGDDKFATEVYTAAGEPFLSPSLDIRAIFAAVCKAASLSEAALFSASRARKSVQARAAAAYLVIHFRAGTLTELARYLGRDVATLSRAAETARCAASDSVLGNLVHHAESLLLDCIYTAGEVMPVAGYSSAR